MSTGTAQSLDGQSSVEQRASSDVHTGALLRAVREAVAAWGFGVLVVVFMAISLGTSVYQSFVYPVFFALCAAGALAVAAAQTYSRYEHHRFEATNDY